MLTRSLEATDTAAVCELVVAGFREYVAPEWEPQAAQAFIENELSPRRMTELITGAAFTAGSFDERGGLLGVLVLPDPTFLALLFVAPRAFRQGIAAALWRRCREFVSAVSPPVAEVRLNASAYALGFYRKAGFVERERIEKQGRRGTRMVWQVRGGTHEHTS